MTISKHVLFRFIIPKDSLCPNPNVQDVEERMILTKTVRLTRKRKRTTPDELVILEEFYSLSTTPELEQIVGISEKLDWTNDRVVQTKGQLTLRNINFSFCVLSVFQFQYQ